MTQTHYHDRDPGPHLDRNYPPYRRVWHRVTITEMRRDDVAQLVADGPRDNVLHADPS